MADEPQIGISGSDLLSLVDRIGTRLDSGFARIEAKLDGKADKSDLIRIEARLDEHGREIGRLKDQQREDEVAQRAVDDQREKRSTSSQRRWNYALSFALVAVGLLGVLAGALHW